MRCAPIWSAHHADAAWSVFDDEITCLVDGADERNDIGQFRDFEQRTDLAVHVDHDDASVPLAELSLGKKNGAESAAVAEGDFRKVEYEDVNARLCQNEKLAFGERCVIGVEPV